MSRKLEFYPEGGNQLYCVEFSNWEGGPEQFRLFQRNFSSDENWAKMKDLPTLAGGEFHPFKLLEGDVIPEGLVDFGTKTFLKFVVDSLNKNSPR